MIKFNVYSNGKLIDSVFYGEGFLKGFKSLEEVKEYIKKGLVEHDGYKPNITLKASK